MLQLILEYHATHILYSPLAFRSVWIASMIGLSLIDSDGLSIFFDKSKSSDFRSSRMSTPTLAGA